MTTDKLTDAEVDALINADPSVTSLESAFRAGVKHGMERAAGIVALPRRARELQGDHQGVANIDSAVAAIRKAIP